MQGKIIILGKPNVGKSSLFNRLLRDKIAITSEVEGTTRDINIRPLLLGEAENPLNIELCDTAGLMKKANGIFKNVKKMIFDFIKKDDLILYVISAELGIEEEDLRFFRSLKNAALVVNKTDIEKNERWEYSAFGAGKIFYVSSLHNRGIKQLKDFLTIWASNSVLGIQFRTCEKNLDSAESQNLNQNNSVRSTQTRPLRGAKNREQGRSSASADFLLEADKRGSPPKSEKRQLLGTHFKKVGGSGAGGAVSYTHLTLPTKA